MYILKGLSLQLFGHLRQKTKKCHKFLKLWSKIAKIHAWKKIQWYKKALISRKFSP